MILKTAAKFKKIRNVSYHVGRVERADRKFNALKSSRNDLMRPYRKSLELEPLPVRRQIKKVTNQMWKLNDVIALRTEKAARSLTFKQLRPFKKDANVAFHPGYRILEQKMKIQERNWRGHRVAKTKDGWTGLKRSQYQGYHQTLRNRAAAK